uniref:Uncharacterized protein n=1 Tax=Chromera velia CCMP2878 TaxID=1169474 RepID=A0A0G4G9W4_9ALVE|eukprot:Cvel_20868.t1-p1 / transcript=Cvel_20868.t1 / gene=Cvel_20868 / organism=Chromera_velia_CCMP2878 / gene_product=hypothetical protein / transcript_product=hypothetical protein / location=Cvel_scaffold1912:30666-32487(+) / protein_length=356 / sequence_SO=supercontig / SO=protein_coding / is_pseudo=false
MGTFSVSADLLKQKQRTRDNLFFLRVLLENPKEDLKTLTSTFTDNAALMETDKDFRETNGMAILKVKLETADGQQRFSLDCIPHISMQVQTVLRKSLCAKEDIGVSTERALLDALPAAFFQRRTKDDGSVVFEATRMAKEKEEAVRAVTPAPAKCCWRYSKEALERYKRQLCLQLKQFPEDQINVHRQAAVEMADGILTEKSEGAKGEQEQEGEAGLLRALMECQKRAWGQTPKVREQEQTPKVILRPNSAVQSERRGEKQPRDDQGGDWESVHVSKKQRRNDEAERQTGGRQPFGHHQIEQGYEGCARGWVGMGGYGYDEGLHVQQPFGNSGDVGMFPPPPHHFYQRGDGGALPP